MDLIRMIEAAEDRGVAAALETLEDMRIASRNRPNQSTRFETVEVGDENLRRQIDKKLGRS